MARYSTAFVWAALAYFTIGMFIGVAMAVEPSWMAYLRVVHVHVNLLGWVSMFIFAVAYHVVPRFVGHPLHSARLADVHVVLANVGLAGFVIAYGVLGPGTVVAVFATIALIGNLLFVYNIARTLLTARINRRLAFKPPAVRPPR